MKKMFVGPCPICDKRIFNFKMPPIFQWNEEGGRINWRRRAFEMNAEGTHFWILQSDGSRMMVAVCRRCLLTLNDEQVKKIFADIIYTKLSSVKGDSEKDYKLFDRIRTIEVWKWFYNETELVAYLEEKNAEEHSPAKTD